MFLMFGGYVAFNNLIFKHLFSSFRKRRTLNCVNSRMIAFRSKSSSIPTFHRYSRRGIRPQEYDAFLALDFEASIASKSTTITQQEIIEFPCVWIDGKTMNVTRTFHRYVRPVVHDTLDPFCTELTGISDDMLRKENTFIDVFEDFKKWYQDIELNTNAGKTVFVTCGDWDLRVMLPNQCALSNVPVPDYMSNWINIKSSFEEVMGRYPRSLKDMVYSLNLNLVGRLHRGIDDTLNVANIIKVLGERGHVFHT